MRNTLRIVRIVLSVLAVAGSITVVGIFYPPAVHAVQFPGGKRFAFTIVDDTDQTSLERVRPLYEFMYQAGLRTTKTIWVMEPNELSVLTNKGHTLRDSAYRDFIIELQEKGFEIALHGVRGGSSPRQDILRGLDEFNAQLGQYPRLHVNHAVNKDNIYWGQHRWAFAPYRWGFALLRPFEFTGHEPGSKYFWGDAAQRHIQYVRRFTFSDINVLKINPAIPYRMATMPYVNYWFDASNGGSIDAFEKLLSSENLDRLEREGGVALVYAHLGAGSFNREDGAIDRRFAERIKDVASRNGWFAPASQILDLLGGQPNRRAELSMREMIRLETVYLKELVR